MPFSFLGAPTALLPTDGVQGGPQWLRAGCGRAGSQLTAGHPPAEAWQLVQARGGGFTHYAKPDRSEWLSLKVMDRDAWQRSKLRAWMGTLGGCRDDEKDEWASWTAQAMA